MGILDRVTRVDVGGGDWIDVRPFSVEELRELQREAREVVPEEGQDSGEAQGFALYAKARERIVAWSDTAELTPENTARIPIEVNSAILKSLIGVGDLPLASGSPSTATSEE